LKNTWKNIGSYLGSTCNQVVKLTLKKHTRREEREEEDDSWQNQGIVEEKKKTIPGKTTESWKRKRRRFPAKPQNRRRKKEVDSQQNHGIVEVKKRIEEFGLTEE